jgi:predicted RNase H-like HicB family nuclease
MKADSTYYPRVIYRLEDGTYLAYCVDFGESTCSACGDTPLEAMEILDKVLQDVIEYFTSKGSKLPESCMMWKTSLGWA